MCRPLTGRSSRWVRVPCGRALPPLAPGCRDCSPPRTSSTRNPSASTSTNSQPYPTGIRPPPRLPTSLSALPLVVFHANPLRCSCVRGLVVTRRQDRGMHRQRVSYVPSLKRGQSGVRCRRVPCRRVPRVRSLRRGQNRGMHRQDVPCLHDRPSLGSPRRTNLRLDCPGMNRVSTDVESVICRRPRRCRSSGERCCSRPGELV
jgi:hypothetical protein